MSSRYDLTRTRGGKDDMTIEDVLKDNCDALRRGDKVDIKLLRVSPWQGKDQVDIQSNCADFLDRKDHTFSPAAIRAAVRVLHRYGFRGLFEIKVSRDILSIQPCIERKDSTSKLSLSGEFSSARLGDVKPLWKRVLANPVPLFKTVRDEPLLAVFDEKGFFLFHEAQQIYNRVKSLPHIYAARLESGNAYYFGISNQPGGRWKRSHAYHLGGLAYEILKTKRDDNQDRSHWVRAWFEPLGPKRCGSYYVIRMKERVIISFFAPRSHASKAELEKAECLLIDVARQRGPIVLNKRG